MGDKNHDGYFISLIKGHLKSETNFILHDWFKNYGVVRLWVTNGLVLPIGGVPTERVCYSWYIVYWRPANISIGHFVDQPLKCNRKSRPVNSVEIQ